MAQPTLHVQGLTQVLRRPAGRRRPVLRGRPGRDLRAARAQRRRQDHHDLDDLRPARPPTPASVDGRGRRRSGRAAIRGRELIGYVPQEIALYPDLSGRDNLAFFARLYGLRGAAAPRPGSTRPSRWSASPTGPATRSRSTPAACSAGSTSPPGCCTEPRLLILDEPTVGIDPQSRNAILEAVAALGESRHERALHHPLHGGGRAALPPGRHRRPRPAARGRAPAASWSPWSTQHDRSRSRVTRLRRHGRGRRCSELRRCCGRRHRRPTRAVHGGHGVVDAAASGRRALDRGRDRGQPTSGWPSRRWTRYSCTSPAPR